MAEGGVDIDLYADVEEFPQEELDQVLLTNHRPHFVLFTNKFGL